ncbi:hypothetical protein K3495_g2919 [Podosphaera aphanis]|nr:hypothetical protein K3495_g2919 [Podosphaera aphanis]
MSVKRTANDVGIERRIRARRDSSSDEELALSDAASEVTATEEESESSSESDSGGDPASISFGALAKAQAALSAAPAQITSTGSNPEDGESTPRQKHEREATRRQSKHAPMEITSKRAVTRKREVIPLIKRVARDPRFEPGNAPVDKNRVQAAYSFLDEYREDEMKELKATIKSTKDAEERDKLKRTLLVMESKKKTRLRKLKEQEVLERHKKQEKALVQQGKQPFYLKKAEQRNQVLLDQFKELKGKQIDRVIERRRKKIDGREKKKMPFSRRTVE